MMIGTVVEVRARMFRERDGHRRFWERVPFPQGLVRGMVTGKGRRLDGERIPESGGTQNAYSYSGIDDYEPASWSTSKVHTVWLVRFALTGPEFPVHPEDLEEAMIWPSAWVLPTVSGWDDGAITEDYKRRMREEMAKVPRDARGRWLPLVAVEG